MSSETTTRKKRSVSDATPSQDGDHRKRRRNRTTQSCLNCHTSKRMCDRKRPACARCTQLGLTGLCVYEVDDPSQRSDSQDESSRLLKRVAELEGVIRELKNKPHPRWVQSGNNPEDYDKWHTRAQTRAGSSEPTEQPSCAVPPSPGSSDKGDVPSTPSSSSGHRQPAGPRQNVYPAIALHSPSAQSPYYNSSPQSTPSPSTMTPTDEYPLTQAAIASHSTHDYDLSSMFLSYPSLMGCEEGAYGHIGKESQDRDQCFVKQPGGHCGCLHEASNYNVVLELSLRLRKAADVLARSAGHHMGSNCALNQRIADLDAFATNALGNISSPPEDMSTPLATPDRSQHGIGGGSMSHAPPTFGPGATRTLSGATVSPQSLHSLRSSWELMPSVSSASVSCDDSFMSWEPPRRG
ncbi:hypothetical protein BDN72DRAFT_892326 [Pluteus cervinus]|uniref:Uncharacterized protein n=1 Tax=Pluteus cervinus TaxID=181527 RepID=A0ACD3BBC9_9AGAR|nr:hypothetical protein BDN72DRAFT_892326 [Pluteus cervinus]